MAYAASTTGPVTRAIRAVREDGPALIVPRRNFIMRALGFTAAGAALTVPVVAIESTADRISYHRAELERAFREHYAGLPVDVKGNDTGPSEVARGHGGVACLVFLAGPVGMEGGRA